LLEDNTLQDAIQKISQYKIHRLGIHSKDNKFLGIISQSDIIQFANKNISNFPLADQTLQQLGLIRNCVMMRAEAALGDVLEVISGKGISAVALVDNEHKCVANLSASDLRGLTRAVFSWMHRPAVEFLKNFAKELRKPIIAQPDAKLRDCIQILVKERIHRLYLVDKDQRPQSVVSLSDIIPLLSESKPLESL